MSNVTLVIPTYRNPKCLDLCLKSAVENRADPDNQILVVVDGFFEESKEVLEKYGDVMYLDLGQNHGMQYSQNVGVMQSNTEYIFIINDDNVMPKNWDQRVLESVLQTKQQYGNKFVLTVNQIEPTGPSIFNFSTLPLGESAETFDYQKWLDVEPTYSSTPLEETGNIYPFVIAKKWYLAVGGFDVFYDSPNMCDWDFFLKLEFLGFKSPRTKYLHLYHFGSVATKKNAESQKFMERERNAFDTYQWKWGNMPYNHQGTNSKFPPNRRFRGFSV